MAVSVPDHNELWSSNSLSGGNAGSPVIYQTRNQQSYIALTHNSDVVLADNSTAKTGHFTLLRAGEFGHDDLDIVGYLALEGT